MSEQDLSRERELWFAKQADTLKRVFESRRINFYACHDIRETKNQMLHLLKSFCEEERTHQIGFADSVTLHELDIFRDISRLENVQVCNPFERLPDGKLSVFSDAPPGKLDLPYDEYYKRISLYVDKMRQALLSDVFIVGANAITMEGEIVSVDGSGNRVSGMIFGPRKVIVVVGRNKIVKDIDSALWRIHNVAAPLNYIRHNEKHHNRYDDLPCLKAGKCVRCSHPRSACMSTVIVRGAVEFNKDRIHLILVNEDLGL